MKYSEFILGKYIQSPKEREGYINFICKDYITLCLNEIPHNSEYAEHAILPYRQVLISLSYTHLTLPTSDLV